MGWLYPSPGALEEGSPNPADPPSGALSCQVGFFGVGDTGVAKKAESGGRDLLQMGRDQSGVICPRALLNAQ